MKNKKIKNLIIFIMLIVIISSIVFVLKSNEPEVKTIKSAKELEMIYEGRRSSQAKEIFINVLGMPFSFITQEYYYAGNYENVYDDIQGGPDLIVDSISPSYSENTSSSTGSTVSKDYSTTNIQVENVDEADITKTDGDYIYSISENNVVITNVMNPEDVKIAAKIYLGDYIPEDLILYKDKLVVIAAESSGSSSWYYYSNNNNTVVNIYDITNKEEPKLVKNYKLYEPYYTSRCIDNKLYVISTGNLRKEDDDIVTYYTEDNEQKEISFDNMYYLKDIETRKQTLISMVDLNTAEEVSINSYFIDISNAYVSENNIYLLDQEYEGSSYSPPVSSLFGPWGAIGPFKYEYDDDYGYYTKIYKFNILEDGTIKYCKKAKVKGKTINQYSIDEYNENLRLALYDNDGSRVVVFDKDLKEIGKTTNLAKGETMYSSRFMGNKAYLVTYRTIDPLYVIDLSDATKPKVLGELKIPGYSTYLHPYDENHLIGIGMETKETVHRDSWGRVTSTSATIVGMKMALFDVSDVKNPIQISSTVIGDSRTTSAILTNPKALLFSKEKELIAIPINNYAEDFEVTNSSDSYSSIINSYTGYNKSYIAEGYAVYKINTTEGFNLKGIITHDKSYNNYYYGTNTKLLRGLYIEDNLYTISENAIKVNSLDNLELISSIDLQEKDKVTLNPIDEASKEVENNLKEIENKIEQVLMPIQ